MQNIVETGSLRPTTPCLPLTLSRLLHGLTRETTHTMANLASEERETLASLLPVYRAYLQPGERTEISALLARLRGHYFVPNMSNALAQAVAEDWANDLERFPLWLVKAACDYYRWTQPIRAPKPANIIAFCQDGIDNERQEMREIELALATKPATEEPRRATAEQVGAIIDRAGLREDMDRIAEQRARRP